MVVAAAPSAVVDTHNQSQVNTGNGLVKAGLVIQLIILAAFTLFVWRFHFISEHWDVDWTAGRRVGWTWRKLLTIVLASLGLLFVRQLYHLVRFFRDWSGLAWLGLIFDAGPIFSEPYAFAIYHHLLTCLSHHGSVPCVSSRPLPTSKAHHLAHGQGKVPACRGDRKRLDGEEVDSITRLRLDIYPCHNHVSYNLRPSRNTPATFVGIPQSLSVMLIHVRH